MVGRAACSARFAGVADGRLVRGRERDGDGDKCASADVTCYCCICRRCRRCRRVEKSRTKRTRSSKCKSGCSRNCGRDCGCGCRFGCSSSVFFGLNQDVENPRRLCVQSLAVFPLLRRYRCICRRCRRCRRVEKSRTKRKRSSKCELGNTWGNIGKRCLGNTGNIRRNGSGHSRRARGRTGAPRRRVCGLAARPAKTLPLGAGPRRYGCGGATGVQRALYGSFG